MRESSMPPEVPVVDAEPKPDHIEVGHYGAQLASHPDALAEFRVDESTLPMLRAATACEKGEAIVWSLSLRLSLLPRYAAARMLSIPIPDSRCASRSLDMRFSYDLGGWFGRVFSEGSQLVSFQKPNCRTRLVRRVKVSGQSS